MVLGDKAGPCLIPSPKATKIPKSHLGGNGKCEGEKESILYEQSHEYLHRSQFYYFSHFTSEKTEDWKLEMSHPEDFPPGVPVVKT